MRLIDADDFINEIKYHLWDWNTVNGITAQTVLKQTITDIQNQPTVDAVPVVRCKECVHFAMFKDSVKKAGICKIGYGYCIENNFCSYGVRKDDSN